MKRLIVLCVCFVVLCSSLCSCLRIKNDEEKIKSQINAFVFAYNSGDLTEVLECMDSKTRNTYKAAINITGSLLGGVSVSDLFSLGVGLSEGDALKVTIIEVTISDESNAMVKAILECNNSLTENVSFSMVKENGEWYIKNIN